MKSYYLRPQDPIPADASPDQLTYWYHELSWKLRLMKKQILQIPIQSRRFDRCHYSIIRAQHELKKVREAAAARPYILTGPDLSLLQGITHAK